MKRSDHLGIALIDKWLADESGYDERAWPIAKAAIEENRLTTRRRFAVKTKIALPKLSEKAFMAQVIQLAQMLGWRVYHTSDSRRSEPGYPDLSMLRPGDRHIYVEIKTEKGKLTDDQRWWVGNLCALDYEIYVWRPSDWPEIERVLAWQSTIVTEAEVGK